MTGVTGLSGAHVLLVDDNAIKLGYDVPNRVTEQGAWLQANHGANLPKVHAMLPRGYVMERLDTLATGEVDLERVVNALQDTVWCSAPVNKVDTPRTLLKVTAILERHAPDLVTSAIDALAYIRTTTACLSHGDPTAENVMRRGDTYVVIDPIPSTEAVPDDLAVDVGKLLQSAHGWEQMKGEQRSAWTVAGVNSLFEREVAEVGQLWCIVHFIRTLPYTPKEVKPRVLAKLRDLLGV